MIYVSIYVFRIDNLRKMLDFCGIINSIKEGCGRNYLVKQDRFDFIKFNSLR